MTCRSTHSAIDSLCPAPACVIDCLIKSGSVLRTVLGVVQGATSSYATNFEAMIVEVLCEFLNLLFGSQLAHDFESDLNRVEAEALGLL